LENKTTNNDNLELAINKLFVNSTKESYVDKY
jgi:hypothetical protein